MPTMNVSLTKEMVEFVEDEISRGDYVSASEVVRDALRVLRQDRDAREAALQLLRAEVQKGIEDEEAGRFSDRSVNEIFDVVMREHKA
ncbi:MAG: type II toxin-antitoxin system ParD family antitoxin [Rhizobiaceae bacterium]|nr:type II toxin-antitoxin system ParD family antitoxin [Rhizobiaceae bacterium]